jgi:hypothetical protein
LAVPQAKWKLIGRSGLALVCLSLSSTPPLPAQDVQPRWLSPAPVGSHLVGGAYSFSTGAVLMDKTIPVEDIDGDVHAVLGAYGYAFGFFGMSAKADLALPFAAGRWSGTRAEIDSTVSRTGLGDPVARFMFMFVGAPALREPEFAKHHSRTVAGFDFRVRVPLGQYDSSKLINIGTNRFTFSPRAGVSQSFGRLITEVYASGWFFTDNTEALGTNVQSQDALMALQLHFIWDFGQGLWAAASTRQSFGGQLYINGHESGQAQSNNRIGVSVSVPIARRQALRFAITLGVTTTAGNDYNTFSGAWQGAWGGGLSGPDP